MQAKKMDESNEEDEFAVDSDDERSGPKIAIPVAQFQSQAHYAVSKEDSDSKDEEQSGRSLPKDTLLDMTEERIPDRSFLRTAGDNRGPECQGRSDPQVAGDEPPEEIAAQGRRRSSRPRGKVYAGLRGEGRPAEPGERGRLQEGLRQGTMSVVTPDNSYWASLWDRRLRSRRCWCRKMT